MNTPLLRKHLEKHILPMFTGSELTEHDEKPRAWKKRRAFLHNACEMYVRAAHESNKYFMIRRSQAFDQADADFVEYFVENLHALATSNVKEEFIEDLINPVLRRSVAQKLAPRILTHKDPSSNILVHTPLPDTTKLITKIFAQFEAWAEQTYEGRKIAAAVGLDAANTSPNGVNVMEVFRKQFGIVVANGLETFLTANAVGDLVGHTSLDDKPVNDKLFSPLRFSRLADWSRGARIGIGLSRNGEILAFANKALVFAKRRGVWRHFTPEAVVKRMSMRTSFHPRVCSAVYQTCLDVSFAKTGGGIALIRKLELGNLSDAGLISEYDLVTSKDLKGRFLGAITGKPFYALDRQLRQDIVAMDGATVLDYNGNIIAAGAIIKVEAGSDGGGRLSAAKTLAKYGQGIKISSDGEIRGFKQNDRKTGVEEFFTVG